MAAYSIEFTKSAKKEFDRLSDRMQDRVLEALGILSQNPFSELLKTKKIKGAQNLYRIRISAYRIVYDVQKDRLLIIVIKIGHRKEVYRHF